MLISIGLYVFRRTNDGTLSSFKVVHYGLKYISVNFFVKVKNFSLTLFSLEI